MSRLRSRLLHYAMNNPLFVGERTALIAATQGRVLEICIEDDKNIHYYSPWVTDLAIVRVEGSPGESRLDTNERGLRVERIFSGRDNPILPFADSSFDWVVTTLTLCRTNHSDAVLREVRRVLKPSGTYLFLEHGRSSDPVMNQWQRRVRKLWLNFGGCDLDREIDKMIGAAGLQIQKLERYQHGRPRFLYSMYRGAARR